MSRGIQSVITFIGTLIGILIDEVFFNQITSNAVLEFMITFTILYLTTSFVHFFAGKISKKKMGVRRAENKDSEDVEARVDRVLGKDELTTIS